MNSKFGLFIVLLFCIGCQTGRIPCPKIKGVKLQSSNSRRTYSPVLSARAEETPHESSTAGKSKSVRYITNVDIEEWDCPRPGTKKLMPKKIRNNIRRNAELINQEQQTVRDTVAREH